MSQLVTLIKRAGFLFRETDFIHVFEAGSALHGARLEGKSDLDMAGVFIEPPTRSPLSMEKYEHFVTSTGDGESRNTADDEDIQTHSLRHWAFKTIGGNPTLLAYLYSPITLGSNVWSEMILPNTDAFVAKKHTKAYIGYAKNQLHRMFGGLGKGKHGQRPELEAKFGYNTKAAMHMIRLLYEGIELMKDGRLTFPRPEKNLLLEIRNGEWGQERIKKHFRDLESELQLSENSSPLPETVDLVRVSSIVTRAYLSHWQAHYPI